MLTTNNQQPTTKIKTTSKSLMGDLHTAMGIYLKLRDKFRDTILLESADHNVNNNSFSYIAINAIAGIEIKNQQEMEVKFPLTAPEKHQIPENFNITEYLENFSKSFDCEKVKNPVEKMAQGLFGYTSFDAVQFFETIQFKPQSKEVEIPILRYRFYQYVIAINHFNDEMFLIENKIDG
ncbi:MAG: anthranilate synthase component I family protein, partial [Cloacibacterium sp.]